MDDCRWLVTVGTTPFDSLIETLDGDPLLRGKLRFQIASGNYIPVNNDYFRYSSDIWAKHNGWRVVCHCGAGTAYGLLEAGVRFIGVPNVDRLDKHQLELARFLEKHGYAPICYEPRNVRDFIVNGQWETFDWRPYTKTNFFRQDDIRLLINQEVSI